MKFTITIPSIEYTIIIALISQGHMYPKLLLVGEQAGGIELGPV